MVTNEDIKRLMLLESRGNPRAVNANSGAQGLMQVMPATGRKPGFGVAPLKNPFDPNESVRFGRDYFGAMMNRYGGDKRRALAAYNWGPGHVDGWDGDLGTLPEETRNYITAFEAGTDQKGNPWSEQQLATAQGFLGDDGLAAQLVPGNQLPATEIAQNEALAAELGITPQGGDLEALAAALMPPAASSGGASLVEREDGPGMRIERTEDAMSQHNAMLEKRDAAKSASPSMPSEGGNWGRQEIGLALQALGEGLSAISQRRAPDMSGVQRQIAARDKKAKEGKALNQTIEYLRKKGMGDLADLAEAGSMSAGDALMMGLKQPQDDRTALIKNFEYARSQGYPGDFSRFLNERSGGTTVNIGDKGLAGAPQGYDYLRNPDGQVRITDGRVQLVPIQGGPAAAELSQAAETQRFGQKVEAEKFGRLQGDVTRAIDLAREGYGTGAFSMLAALPIPSDARTLGNVVDTLKANLGFEAIQAMRDASPTGGALGQVTERELGFLQSTVANLDTGAGEEELTRQLNKVRNHLTTLRDISQGTYQIPSAIGGRGGPVTIDGVTIEEVR